MWSDRLRPHTRTTLSIGFNSPPSYHRYLYTQTSQPLSAHNWHLLPVGAVDRYRLLPIAAAARSYEVFLFTRQLIAELKLNLEQTQSASAAHYDWFVHFQARAHTNWQLRDSVHASQSQRLAGRDSKYTRNLYHYFLAWPRSRVTCRLTTRGCHCACRRDSVNHIFLGRVMSLECVRYGVGVVQHLLDGLSVIR